MDRYNKQNVVGCIISSCATQAHIKFILLINVKMPTIVGILTFISRINTISESLTARSIFFQPFCIKKPFRFSSNIYSEKQLKDI